VLIDEHWTGRDETDNDCDAGYRTVAAIRSKPLEKGGYFSHPARLAAIERPSTTFRRYPRYSQNNVWDVVSFSGPYVAFFRNE
jgi:hypothetical protein